jgi:predicted metal-dependent hydrolase
MRRPTRDRFLRGRALFDSGSFFAAHEVWEEAWLEESGAVRVFLQGLIQIAAALHKASRKERAGGCVRLFDAGLAKLEAVTPASGLPRVARFLRATRKVRERAAAWQRGDEEAPPPDGFPRLAPRARATPPGAARSVAGRTGSVPRRRRP